MPLVHSDADIRGRSISIKLVGKQGYIVLSHEKCWCFHWKISSCQLPSCFKHRYHGNPSNVKQVSCGTMCHISWTTCLSIDLCSWCIQLPHFERYSAKIQLWRVKSFGSNYNNRLLPDEMTNLIPQTFGWPRRRNVKGYENAHLMKILKKANL